MRTRLFLSAAIAVAALAASIPLASAQDVSLPEVTVTAKRHVRGDPPLLATFTLDKREFPTMELVEQACDSAGLKYERKAITLINYLYAVKVGGSCAQRTGANVCVVYITAPPELKNKAYVTIALDAWHTDLGERIAECMGNTAPLRETTLVNPRMFTILEYASVVDMWPSCGVSPQRSNISPLGEIAACHQHAAGGGGTIHISPEGAATYARTVGHEADHNYRNDFHLKPIISAKMFPILPM